MVNKKLTGVIPRRPKGSKPRFSTGIVWKLGLLDVDPTPLTQD
jgi:hypothetical protein